jgi:Putative Flp pilus-assembly TadE/G-like
MSHRSERGQVLVMFAGGLVVFLAIAALVIDVGFIWMTRRHQQDAADPGAVAAARYIQAKDYTSMVRAACFYAQQNGYFALAANLDQCDSTHDPAGASLAVNWPPKDSGPPYVGHLEYVEVEISQPQNAFFAGVVGIGRFTVSSAAVAAYDTGTSNSASLMALNAANCPQGGGTITGGAQVHVFLADGVTGPGGYVQVNSNCSGGTLDNSCTTGGGQGGLNVDGTSSIQAPQVNVVGNCTGGGSVTSDPLGTNPLAEGAPYVGDPLDGIGPPPFPTGGTACAPGNKMTTAAGAEGCKFNSGATVALAPGTYYGGWNINGSGVQITLSPGIYVIAGGGITQTGGTLSSAGGRVLIFSTDDPQYSTACKTGTATKQASQCQGKIDLSGASSLSLTGLVREVACPPATIVGQTGCPYGGLLLWQDGNGSNPTAPVLVEGKTNLNLSGTIYAPKANVTVTGNTVLTGCTPTAGNTNCAAIQVISDTWNFNGGANLQVPYDPRLLYQLPLKGLVR